MRINWSRRESPGRYFLKAINEELSVTASKCTKELDESKGSVGLVG